MRGFIFTLFYFIFKDFSLFWPLLTSCFIFLVGFVHLELFHPRHRNLSFGFNHLLLIVRINNKKERKKGTCRERIDKFKKIKIKFKKKRKRKLLNLQKLPEVPNRKRGWRMRKRKRHSSWQRGPGILSLSGSARRTNNTILLSGVWAPRIRLWT